MSLSARQSRLHLAVGGSGFAVLGLSGSEVLNQPFAFDVSVLADAWAVVADRLGEPVSLRMTAPDGFERQINGVLSGAKVEAHLADGQVILQLTIESSLVLLQQRTDSRLILSETLPGILRQTLCRNGMAESTLRFQLAREYPLRPSTLQAQENDLEFLLRLTGRQGLFLWSDAEESDEILYIADTTNHCPMLARQVLTYLPGAGLETEGDGAFKVGMLRIEDRAELVSGRYWGARRARKRTRASATSGARHRTAGCRCRRYPCGELRQRRHHRRRSQTRSPGARPACRLCAAYPQDKHPRRRFAGGRPDSPRYPRLQRISQR